MNKTLLKNIIPQLATNLYPFFGLLKAYEIYYQNGFIFSEIVKIKLYFNNMTKNVVLKRPLSRETSNAEGSFSLQREYQILSFLYDRFSSLQHINVVKPLTFLANESILVTEDFTGDKLNALIIDNVRWLPSAAKLKRLTNYSFLCGKWLRHFQEFTRQDETVTFNNDDYIEKLEKRIQRATKSVLEPLLAEQVLEFIHSTLISTESLQFQSVGHHSDFTPWNILAYNDKIRVLDLDRFSYRCKYDDLTMFLCCLEAEKAIVGMLPRTIDILTESFLQGYDIENIESKLFYIYLIKNIITTLNRIDPHNHANTQFWHVQYEKFRKRKKINVLMNFLKKTILH